MVIHLKRQLREHKKKGNMLKILEKSDVIITDHYGDQVSFQ